MSLKGNHLFNKRKLGIPIKFIFTTQIISSTGEFTTIF